MSTHLYAVFAQTVIAAGSDVLTLLLAALRHDNCTCKLGQQLSVQLCLMFQGNSPQSFQGKGLSSAILGDWRCFNHSGRTTGSWEPTGFVHAESPSFLMLPAGSEGRLNGPNLQAKQERRWYCNLADWMLKHVPTHLKAPLSRKAAEKGPRLTNLSYD